MSSQLKRHRERNKGLRKLINGAYKGGLGIWLGLSNVFILAATIIFLICGYNFFTSTTADEHTFWGMCTVVAVLLQIGLKQWVWLEITRTSILTEIQSLKDIITEYEKPAKKD